MNLDPAMYEKAQHALTELKSSVLRLLLATGQMGLKNSQIGRGLGIYAGHVGHQGHISRTVLAMLEAEGLLRQDATSKKWFVKNIDELHKTGESEDDPPL
jgi:hypothetical protein